MEKVAYLLEQALALTSEWVSVSDLPGDPNSGSRCIVYFGLAERKSETIYASGLPCGVKVFYRMSSNNVSVTAELLIKKFKEECDLRYQEECTTRENPLRVYINNYPTSKCSNKDGMPGDHQAEGRLLNPQGKPISHQCKACAEEIINEYREKLGWKWSFEPYKRENTLRYPEELTSRENPLRVGTKRIKIKGVEYPFIAVSDHWRPTLLHESRMVWVHHYRAVKGLRPGIFRVYYAKVKVPYNRLPWTVDNELHGEFTDLVEAIDAAMRIVGVKMAAASLGKLGGMARSEKKAMGSRENGKMGGRRKQFSALDMEEEKGDSNG